MKKTIYLESVDIKLGVHIQIQTITGSEDSSSLEKGMFALFNLLLSLANHMIDINLASEGP